MTLGDRFRNIHPGIYTALVVAVSIFALTMWLDHWNSKKEVPVNTWVPAAQAKQVKNVEKVDVPIKKIKVYKEKAKAKLKLPDDVFDDVDKHVLDTARVEASDNPHTVTSVVDIESGEVQTYVRKEPLPWVAWDTRGEAGLYGGIKNGVPTVRLEAKQGVFQVKALHFGVMGSIDQPLTQSAQGTDYFVGAGVWARW